MSRKENNYAFIDGSNVYMSLKSLGWSLDFKKFRIYLKDKYSVSKAYWFTGYIEENVYMYKKLEKAGFTCIFKQTIVIPNNSIKGNCDAELVLQAMIDFSEYDKAVIVSGDGDFYCLVNYLVDENKLCILLVPNKYKLSALLRRQKFCSFSRFMNDLEDKLTYKKEKTP